MTLPHTSTRDIARLRELAASGMSAAAASRVLGRYPAFASLWAPRYGIAFVPHARVLPEPPSPSPPPHPALADLAMARLVATMQRLQSYQESCT